VHPPAASVALALRLRLFSPLLLGLLLTTVCASPQPTASANIPVRSVLPMFVRGTFGRDSTCQAPGYNDDNGCYFGTGIAHMRQAGFNAVQAEPIPGALAALKDSGLMAIVWLGGWDKTHCFWNSPDVQVTETVNSIKGDPEILMYYLADEPLLSSCPHAPAAFAARTALIHNLDPNAKTFTLIQDWDHGPVDYAAWKGAVDVLGFDLYPCTFGNGVDLSAAPKSRKPCDFANVLDANIRRIEAAHINGYIGVLQDFQDCYYEMPSSTELRTQIEHWQKLATHMAGYLVFSWNFMGNQCTYGSLGQQLDDVPGNVAELSYENNHYFNNR
jgi:hypothetical protein